MSTLILVRHGKSQWNALGLWTGWSDVDLAPDGHEEARAAGSLIADITIHAAFTSTLKRTHQTFAGIMDAHGQKELTHSIHPELNERHYGIHTGKNKWEIKEAVGDEEFMRIRRNWDHPIPEGETLKDVHARVVPFFETTIKPHLTEGNNVLVVAHGNTLRALIKHLENIPDDDISAVEIETGEVHIYDIDADGRPKSKEVRKGEVK